MPKRETHEFFFRDDHDRLVRVEVDDFNDGKPPAIQVQLCLMKGTGDKGYGMANLARETKPYDLHDANVMQIHGTQVFEKAAKLCPLHAAWGDGETPSAIELREENKKLQGLLDDPQWGLFSWMGILHERLTSLHRMITNILANA